MRSDEKDGTAGGHTAPETFSEWLHTWRYLFWFVGLAGLILLFYTEENWRGYRAWENYKQQMTARGDRFDAAAYIPPAVPDSDNFAMTPALAPLFEFLPGTQHWIDTNAPRLFQDLTVKYEAAANLVKPRAAAAANSWVRGRTDLELWAAAFLQGTNRNKHATEPLAATNLSSRNVADSVMKQLSDYDAVLDELRTASERPKARFNLRYDQDNPATILLPHLSKIKFMCQVLQLRASAEVALDRMDDAQKDLDLMFYLTDSTREEPIIISQLVRMAELQLALVPFAEGIGRWSEPQLRALQERLEGFDFCADMNRCLKAECVLFGGGMIEYARRYPNKLHLIEEFERSSDDSSSSELWPVGILMTVAPGGWLYQEQLNHSRAFDRYLLPLVDVKKREIRPDAVREAAAAIGKLTQLSPVASFLHHQFFTKLMLPAVSRVSEKTAFAQTAVDTATVACALERYRLAHGQLPESLDKLSPTFLARLPHDIINGKPLVYQVMPNNHYRLYSIGWNEIDDGGLPKQSKKGETERREGDWVWNDAF